MPYSITMSSIDNTPLDSQKLKDFCTHHPNYKFDDNKTWTNVYDYVVLYKTQNNWDYICGFNKDSNYADCAKPDSDVFYNAFVIAEYLNVFIVGESNEIYYIPDYGPPHQHIDFEIAKAVYEEHGYNLDLMIEKATLNTF